MDAANDVHTDVDGLVVEGTSIRIVGLAVSWANRDSYYIALTKKNVQGQILCRGQILVRKSQENLSQDFRLTSILFL